MDGELSEEGKSYDHVKSVLCSQVGTKKDPARIIENALSLKLGPNQTSEDFVEVSAKAYEAAGFTVEQKVMFLSKNALGYEDIQKFVVQQAPSTF